VQGLNCACAKDFIENSDLRQELASDLLEATRELSNVRQSNFQVVTEVRVLINLEAGNDCLDNDWVACLIDLVDNLVLALQVNRAAHQDEGRVQSIFIAAVL